VSAPGPDEFPGRARGPSPSEEIAATETARVAAPPAEGLMIQFAAVEAGSTGRRKGKGLGVGAWLAIVWLALMVFVAVFADVLPTGSHESNVACARKGPLAQEGTADGYLLGCDASGRDMVPRLVEGTRTSLIVAVGAVVVGVLFGGILGMIGGYFSGLSDSIINALFSVFLSIPAVVLALSLTAFLSGPTTDQGGSSFLPSEVILIIALGIVAIPLLGRITRASAISWSQREFVLASRAQGAKNRRVMIREVLPNVLPAMFSIALLAVAVAIVAEGALSILGVGVKDKPSWGNIIADGRTNLERSPHVVLWPSILILLTVLALNFLGDVVRARFDVRESGL
jgi:peptide/nickel transport system permease protein